MSAVLPSRLIPLIISIEGRTVLRGHIVDSDHWVSNLGTKIPPFGNSMVTPAVLPTYIPHLLDSSIQQFSWKCDLQKTFRSSVFTALVLRFASVSLLPFPGCLLHERQLRFFLLPLCFSLIAVPSAACIMIEPTSHMWPDRNSVRASPIVWASTSFKLMNLNKKRVQQLALNIVSERTVYWELSELISYLLVSLLSFAMFHD
jgi:hypothetical protein